MFGAELFKGEKTKGRCKLRWHCASSNVESSRCSSTSALLLTRRRSHFHFGSDPASTNRRHDNARPCPHPAKRSHHHTTGSTITHGCLRHRGSGAAGMRAENDAPSLHHLGVRPDDDPNTCPARSTLQLGRSLLPSAHTIPAVPGSRFRLWPHQLPMSNHRVTRACPV